jgi:hypothetical protein
LVEKEVALRLRLIDSAEVAKAETADSEEAVASQPN